MVLEPHDLGLVTDSVLEVDDQRALPTVGLIGRCVAPHMEFRPGRVAVEQRASSSAVAAVHGYAGFQHVCLERPVGVEFLGQTDTVDRLGDE